MGLSSGTSLGPYEILAPIGAGGMGEVYRARDTRLGREVALKVIAKAAITDIDRLARFEQEARATAALNHANIVAVFDIGQSEQGPYIVSELLEGETLRERISRSRLTPRMALTIGAQIARGLAAAQDKGIVHRDLKPENVFVTADGTAKILDFGLAKLRESPATSANAPTETARSPVRTGAGVVMGTVGYMAPEQVRGEPADHRSDIFALGAVLYELLTGQRAFSGSTHVETMHAILTAEPPEVSTADAVSTPGVERTVRRCLEKNPIQRFQSARDLAFSLEALSDSRSSGTARATSAERRRVHPGVLLSLALASMLAVGLVWVSQPQETAPPMKLRFEIETPNAGQGNQFAVSPRGTHIVAMAGAAGSARLWVRSLQGGGAQMLAGTEGALWPFWSSDSQSIGFFASGKLHRVELDRGSVRAVTDAPRGLGGTWNAEGVILFAPREDSELFRVIASTGTVVPVTALDAANGETSHRHPYFLPDGRHFLYVVVSPKPGVSGLYLASLDVPRGKKIADTRTRATFAPPNWVIYAQETTLLAQRLDVATQRMVGDPAALDDDVSTFPPNGAAGLSVSTNGLIAFRRNRRPPRSMLRWFDRAGKASPALFPEIDSYGLFELSPDGSRVAVSAQEVTGGRGDLWILDLQRGAPSRFTFDDDLLDRSPVWSPDGSAVAFIRVEQDGDVIYRRNSSGVSPETRLFAMPFGSGTFITQWSNDGRLLLLNFLTAASGMDILTFELSSNAKPKVVVSTPSQEVFGRLSPDGTMLAYLSNESGESQTYIVEFPTPRTRTQVSTTGSGKARWRDDGRELYFASGLSMMAVDIGRSSGGQINASIPSKLFDLPVGFIEWDVTRDGQRFLISSSAATSERPAVGPLQVLLNWLPQ